MVAMRSLLKFLYVASLVFILLTFSGSLFVKAESQSLILLAEQNWDTYRVGGTCVFGTHNLYVTDVDGDGLLEVITGGFSYGADSNMSGSQAPLKVWNWNSENVTLKAEAKWPGLIISLFAGDIDEDDTVEIITFSTSRSDTSNYGSIRIWHLINGDLTLQTGIDCNRLGSAVFVGDADNDGKNEIVSVVQNIASVVPELALWNYQDNTITLDKTQLLDLADVTRANSVYVSDLDNDGKQEIIVGGYSDTLDESKGQLTIWQWNGTDFALLANHNWQLQKGTAKTIAGGVMGNTAVNNVKVADLTGDGLKEIVTGGFTYDGENINGQIKVWSWTGTELTEKASQEWANDYLTEVKCISLNDVDGDGEVEIVQSGIIAAKGSFNSSDTAHDRAQLRVWTLSSDELTLKYAHNWTFDNGACAWNVGSGDLDNDGITEIVTVGCSAYGSLCDPDMRIWALAPVVVNFNLVLLSAIVVGSLFAVIIFTIMILLKKRR